MSSSEDALARRIKYLEQYTNTLHMILDNVVQRLRKIESSSGLDEEGITQSLEWRGKIEATLTQLMLDHTWDWQSSDDPTEVALGNVAYSRILKLCEMLPVDVQMQCWAKVQVPTDLPLVWSEESPTHEQVSTNIKDQTDKALLLSLKDARKYDPK